jgi:hypothetical protein
MVDSKGIAKLQKTGVRKAFGFRELEGSAVRTGMDVNFSGWGVGLKCWKRADGPADKVRPFFSAS